MIKYYILSAFLFCCQLSKAQSPVRFDYDNAGNRILRVATDPLPVTLIDFTAVRWPAAGATGNNEGATALLNWETASEINADRFEIERSQQGKNWINIGEVVANGDKSSSSRYSFLDKNPMDGENLYRLKMIDKDGTFSFSRIQSVHFDLSISFYPNPVKDRLKIAGIVNGRIQILNNAGKEVYNSANIPSDGIDMDNLSTGIYLVKITHKDGSQTTKKIVKQ